MRVFEFPSPSLTTPTPSTRRVGLAGEHLVAHDLVLAGYDCFLGAEGDVDLYAIRPETGQISRVQVKAASVPNARGMYTFSRRGQRLSLRDYAQQVDVLAFVALDIRRVLYRDPALVTEHSTMLVSLAEFMAGETQHGLFGAA